MDPCFTRNALGLNRRIVRIKITIKEKQLKVH